MVGEKLFSILSSLSPEEFKRLRKVFKSPFFTTNERHLILYEFLKKFYPDFNSSNLNKEEIFKLLYPDRPFNDGVLRVMIREFSQVTEEYMLLIVLRKNGVERKKLLTSIYNDRNLYPLFAKETEKLVKELKKNDTLNFNHHQDIYELNFAYFFHPATVKLSQDDAPLLEMMEGLDKLYILNKFRICSEMLNRSRIFAKSYDIRLLKELQELTQKDFVPDNILLQLFLLVLKLHEALVPEDEIIFDELKTVFLENYQDLHRLDQSLLLTQMINFVVRKINTGKSGYFEDGLKLYKIALDAGLVLEQNNIDEGVYSNIVNLGCQANEFEWVHDFMLAYKTNLKEAVQDDIFELNKGIYFFYQKDFDNAQQQFMNHGYSPRFQMNARLNLTKTLFEQFLQNESYYDVFNAQIASFRKYLSRTVGKKDYKFKSIINFLAVVQGLMQDIYENKNKQIVIENANNQLVKNPIMASKPWILEKLGDMK